MNSALKIAAGVVVAMTLATGFSGIYTLNEGQQAVILQFGRPVGEAVREPGLHWKVPFVQEVRRFDKRLIIWDDEPSQIPTAGREFIWVNATARWRIVDPLLFLKTVASERGAQSRLNDILDSVVRDLVSANPLIELVRSSSWKELPRELLEEAGSEAASEFLTEIKMGREKITQAMLESVAKIVPQYGIEVVDLRIKRLNYIESVRKRVYARMISERNRIASRFRSEGEGRSAEVLGAMERQLSQIRSEASKRVQEIRGKGDAEAIKIHGNSFGQDPEFFAFSDSLEKLKETPNQNAVLVMTTDSDYYRYLKSLAPPPGYVPPGGDVVLPEPPRTQLAPEEVRETEKALGLPLEEVVPSEELPDRPGEASDTP